jgi:hypothetical protein
MPSATSRSRIARTSSGDEAENPKWKKGGSDGGSSAAPSASEKPSTLWVISVPSSRGWGSGSNPKYVR